MNLQGFHSGKGIIRPFVPPMSTCTLILQEYRMILHVVYCLSIELASHLTKGQSLRSLMTELKETSVPSYTIPHDPTTTK